MSSAGNGVGIPRSQHGQPSARPRIGIAGNAHTRRFYLDPEDLHRLQQVGDVVMIDYDVPMDGLSAVPGMSEIEDDFVASVSGLDVLLLGHGAPRVTERVLAGAPQLTLVGELEGDRRADRVDIAAAADAGVTVVDTTNAASAPVAEWALVLALLGLRQHGRFLDIISGRQMSYADYKTDPPGRELTGKRVGLIGFGHIAWRLVELLRPFEVSIVAYDPYAPRELANALDVDFAPLNTVDGLRCGDLYGPGDADDHGHDRRSGARPAAARWGFRQRRSRAGRRSGRNGCQGPARGRLVRRRRA